jgi:ABC-2 type transport system permease protein
MTAQMFARPAPADTPLARLRWTVTDGLTLIGRELTRLRHGPDELVGALVFPAVLVLLFGYVFGSAIRVPGGGNYREYLMPGLFAMATFTSTVGVMTRVAADASRGVMDRFRSMPTSRSAVPVGQTGVSVLTSILNLTIMGGAALAVGWRAHHGPIRTAEAFLLALVLGYALSWAGVYIGLVVRREETAGQLVPLLLPVTMLSNSFVPTGGMPAWLRTIADWNPVSALTAACRLLFGNPGAPGAGAAWPLAHPVAATLLWSAVLTAIFLPLSVRTYKRKGR